MADLLKENSPVVKLVGDANLVQIACEGVACKALLDTGSQVTTIDSKFVQQCLPESVIHPLK